MTMISVPGISIPCIPIDFSAAPSIATNIVMDAVNDAVGNVFQIGKTGTISQVAFYNGTVTGASGSVDLEVRIETVDMTTGLPSGTLWATNTSAAINVAFNADNQWQTVTLTANANVTAGQYIAIIWKVTALNGAVTNINAARFADSRPNNYYAVDDLTGAGFAKQASQVIYIITPIYNDGSYPFTPNHWITGVVNTRTFNNGSSPSKRALKFQIPAPMRICGFWVWMDFDAGFVAKLYAPDGTTVLAQVTADADLDNTTSAWPYFFLFDGTEVAPGYYDLAANTNYYLSIEPNSVTSLSIYDTTYPSNAALDVFGGGKNWYSSTNSGGTWTDTDTERPFIGLLFNGIDDGVKPPSVWID